MKKLLILLFVFIPLITFSQATYNYIKVNTIYSKTGTGFVTFENPIKMQYNDSICFGDTCFKAGDIVILTSITDSLTYFIRKSDSLVLFVTPTQLGDSLVYFVRKSDSTILYVTPRQLSDSLIIVYTNIKDSVFVKTAGRAGGQTIKGGTAANNILALQATSASGNTLDNTAVKILVGDAGVTEAVTVTNRGRVGIGKTSSLASQLHVYNTTNAATFEVASTGLLPYSANALNFLNTNATSGNYASMWFGRVAGTASAIVSSKLTTSNYGDVEFWTRGATGIGTRMVIMEDGNVGIGTDFFVSRSKLDIVHSSAATTLGGSAILYLSNTNSTANNLRSIGFLHSSTSIMGGYINYVGLDNTLGSEDGMFSLGVPKAGSYISGIFQILADSTVSTKPLSMRNNKIINIATPTTDYDAATKKYVDDNAGDTSNFTLTENKATAKKDTIAINTIKAKTTNLLIRNDSTHTTYFKSKGADGDSSVMRIDGQYVSAEIWNTVDEEYTGFCFNSDDASIFSSYNGYAGWDEIKLNNGYFNVLANTKVQDSVYINVDNTGENEVIIEKDSTTFSHKLNAKKFIGKAKSTGSDVVSLPTLDYYYSIPKFETDEEYKIELNTTVRDSGIVINSGADGYYSINYKINGLSSQDDGIVISLYKNSNTLGEYINYNRVDAADYCEGSLTTIIYLVAGDLIHPRIKSDTGGGTFTVKSSNLNLFRIN